jgi:hypothetical protein
MKKLLALTALLLSGFAFAQSADINDYKYVIVPEKFDFFKEPNKYNMNLLTKMVFEKQGFKVFLSNEKLPDELALDKCKALYGDLLDDSSMLSTSLYIVVKDCYGKELYRSEKGRSKAKDYQKGYYEALREAATSLKENLKYEYSGKDPVTATHPAPAPSPAEKKTDDEPVITPQTVVNETTLFAQPITNGYQLVDTTPKVVLKIYKTSQLDNYTAMGDSKNGVVFKKDNQWFFEYYQDDKLISEKLDIKF